MYRQQIQDMFQFDTQSYKPYQQRKSIAKSRKKEQNIKEVEKSENRKYISRKKQQFHASVVKQKKQKIIKTSRSQRQKSFLQDKMNDMKRELNDEEKRMQFLKTCGERLIGQPRKSWIKVINKLIWSLEGFIGFKCTEEWKRSQIIRQMCLTFRIKHKDLGLAHQSAIFLSKLIYLQPTLISELINYDVLQLSVHYSCDKNLPLSQKDNFIVLMTTILGINPEQFMKRMGIKRSIKLTTQWMFELIRKNTFSQEHAVKIYNYLQYLFEYVSRRWNDLKIQQQLMQRIFEGLNQLAELDQCDESYEKIFRIVLTILNSHASQDKSHKANVELCLMFVNYKRLLGKFLQVSSSKLYKITKLILGLMKHQQKHDDQGGLKQYLKGEQSFVSEEMIMNHDKNKCFDYVVVQINRTLLNCLSHLYRTDQKHSLLIQRLKIIFIQLLDRQFPPKHSNQQHH